MSSDSIIGKSLKNGWVIHAAHPSYSGATGGSHAHCYIARSSNDDEAFVKMERTIVKHQKSATTIPAPVAGSTRNVA